MPKISQLNPISQLTTSSILPVVDNGATQNVTLKRVVEFVSASIDVTFATEIELLQSASSITSSLNAFASSSILSVNSKLSTSSFEAYTASVQSTNTSSLLLSSSFNTFTSSYTTHSSSIDGRLNSLEGNTGSYETKGRGILSGSISYTSLTDIPDGIVSQSVDIADFSFTSNTIQNSTITIVASDGDIVLNADGNVYKGSSNAGNGFVTDGYLGGVIGDTNRVNNSTGNTITDNLDNIINSIPSISSLNTFTSSQEVLNNAFATTGSNTFIGNQIINGSVTIVTPSAGVPNGVSNWNGGGGWNQGLYSNLATTGGTGTGLTVNVVTEGSGYIDINSITINTPGSGYTNGDVITIDNENNIPGTFTISIEQGNSWFFNSSGSLTTPGDINVSGSIYADNLDGLVSSSTQITNLGFATTSSVLNIDTSSLVTTSSFNTYTASISTASLVSRLNSIENVSGSYSTTGSNTFVGNQIISGSITLDNGYITLDNGAIIKDNANSSIAFGKQAAEYNQGTQSVAIGNGAGNYDQNHGATAIGTNAGAFNQGLRATAIGSMAGGLNQGEYAVALGNFAGGTNQASHSIVINATGIQLDNDITSSLKIAPIRNITGSSGVLQYNDDTKEVSYSNIISGSTTFVGNQTIIDGNIYGNESAIILSTGQTSPAAAITVDISEVTIAFAGGAGKEWNIFSDGNTTYNGNLNGVLNLATTGSNSFNGNQTITGSLITTGGITGSILATNGVYSSSAQLPSGLVSGSSQVLNSSNILSSSVEGFSAFSSSVNSRINSAGGGSTDVSMFLSQSVFNTFATSSFMAFSASVNTFTSSANTALSNVYIATASLNSKTGSYATTGSNQFSGSQSITGSLTVTSLTTISSSISANSSSLYLGSGSNLYVQDNALVEITGSLKVRGVARFETVGGDEGGEIEFGVPQTNTTLSTRVVTDIFQNRLRIFDGNTNGVFIDLSKAPTGVNGEITYKTSGYVNAGTFVQLDNLKVTIPTSGNRGASIGAVSTSFTANISATFGNSAGVGGNAANTVSYTTTAAASAFGWNFGAAGDSATYILNDTTNSRVYRIITMIGTSYNNNFISIERLH